MSTKHERRTVYATKRWGVLRPGERPRPRRRLVHPVPSRKAERSLAEIVHHIKPIRDGGAPWSLRELRERLPRLPYGRARARAHPCAKGMVEPGS